MAITLSTFGSRVRTLTRHSDSSGNPDARLSQTALEGFGYDTYKELRTWLQQVAPKQYIATVSGLVVAVAEPWIDLDGGTYTFEHLVRVDKLWDDIYRPVDGASSVSPNEHFTGRITVRQEGCRLIFGPDDCPDIAGTYRVLYHYTPAQLVNPGDCFDIPAALDSALVYKTCGLVLLADGDNPAKFFDLATAELEKARTSLKHGRGHIPQRGGLQRRMGY
jgi:hypothetical protein